jgi:hypothetical protein
MIAAVEAEGDSPPYYSLHFHQLEWLIDRRRIRSFFFQESYAQMLWTALRTKAAYLPG